MKLLILHTVPALFLAVLFTNGPIERNENKIAPGKTLSLTQDDESDSGRMPAIVFKTQEYCRADLKDFEFDVQFKVVSAMVYFTGANFTSLKQGKITSNSLRPVRSLIQQCGPGSIVTFDDVRVIGPDNMVRKIPGATYILY